MYIYNFFEKSPFLANLQMYIPAPFCCAVYHDIGTGL